LATALVQSPLVTGVCAQPLTPSPLQPSLTDPLHAQRFSRPFERGTIAQAPAVLLASGAGETGFDSAGSMRKRRAIKRKPGEPHPPVSPNLSAPGPPQQLGGHTGAPQAAGRASYAEAYRPPDMPSRRPAPPVRDDFEPLGVRVGDFLLRPAIEISRGFDSNPARVPAGASSAFTMVAPELQVRSQWLRHELGASLRGRYTDYDTLSSADQPFADGRVFGRIDVTRQTRIDIENKVLLSTDYPGSPNLPANLARLPVFVTYGGAAGLSHRFNRLELSGKVSVDATRYQDSELTDGTTSSNRDRDFNQYGGVLRAAYEVMHGVKPFVEIGANTRQHELQFDRNGFQRDSQALTPKAGTTFVLSGKLTGEMAVGYLTRRYRDAALPDLRGMVANGSLVWSASGLTTLTLSANSRAEESVVAGVSGALRRDAGVQIDHAFRRWLIGTLKFGYGLDQYVGNGRDDTRTSLAAAVTYKLNPEVWLKGEYRHETLRSNFPNVNYDANIALIGLRLQR
jgi:hypothetical protein